MTQKALVLFSGGKDSTVSLFWAIHKFGKENVRVISFIYPSRPKKEVETSVRICEEADLDLIQVNLEFLETVKDIADVDEVYARPTAYVPMRNFVFYSVCAYYVEKLGIENIVAGHLKSDGEAYQDASEDFFIKINALINFVLEGSFSPLASDMGNVSLQLPLQELSDQEAMILGKDLGAPISESWSCLEDLERPCGVCVSCQDRENALNLL